MFKKISSNIIKILSTLSFLVVSIMWFYHLDRSNVNVTTVVTLAITAIIFYTNYILIKKDVLKKTSILYIWIIAIIAIPRIIAIINFYNFAPVSDASTYYSIANSLATNFKNAIQNESMSEYIVRFPYLVFYPLFFVLPIKIFGNSILVFQLTNLVFAIITGICIYKLIEICTENKKIACIGLMIWALFPSQVLYAPMIYTEHLYVMFSVILLLAYVKYRKFINKNNDKIQINDVIKYSIILGLLFFATSATRVSGMVTIIAIVINELILADKNKFLGRMIVIFGSVIIFLFTKNVYANIVVQNVINEKYKLDGSFWGHSIYVGNGYEESGKWNANDSIYTMETANKLGNKKANILLLNKTIKERIDIGMSKYIKLQLNKTKVFNDPGFAATDYLATTKNIRKYNNYTNVYAFSCIAVILYCFVKNKKLSNMNSIYMLIILGNNLLNCLVESAARYSYFNAILVVLILAEFLANYRKQNIKFLEMKSIGLGGVYDKS